jgi:hypothetical protein
VGKKDTSGKPGPRAKGARMRPKPQYEDKNSPRVCPARAKTGELPAKQTQAKDVRMETYLHGLTNCLF